VWWEETGDGTPVLLVMGQAFGSAMWFRAVPALAARHRVLTFDNRGIGRSPARPHAFTIGDLAADACAVLDAAGVERAHVYGASMGGLVAQELALSHPDRVRSLVLACTGAPDGTHQPAGRGSALRRVLPRSLVLRTAPRPVVRALYGPQPPRDAVREDLRVLARTRTPWWVVEQQARAIAAYESASRVPSLTVPTLVLHGTADRVVPHHHGEALAALVPGARLHLVADAGHNYLTDATDESNDAVLRFLSDVEEDRRALVP
jgi:pimeloyl-ACP methyl ester carboxylesterase